MPALKEVYISLDAWREAIYGNNGSVIETVPDSLTFNLREEKNGKIEWLPIVLSKDELLKRCKLHSDKNVDIVAIDIDDIHKKIITERSGRQIIGGLGVTSSDLPSSSQPTIEATTDVVICSYLRSKPSLVTLQSA